MKNVPFACIVRLTTFLLSDKLVLGLDVVVVVTSVYTNQQAEKRTKRRQHQDEQRQDRFSKEIFEKSL
jgi:hypothetical protein